MKKIVVSYPIAFNRELELVNELLSGEVDFFHLRKPDFEETDMRLFLNQIDKVYRDKIILHSHYHLVNEFGLGGINLNKKALSQVCIESESNRCFIEPLLLKNGQIEVNRQSPEIVSYSAHSFEEIKHLDFKTDYVLLSPVYDSISKPGYESKFSDMEQLRSGLQNTGRNIVALGGVTHEKQDELKALGFFGYAILGDYWHKLIELETKTGHEKVN